MRRSAAGRVDWTALLALAALLVAVAAVATAVSVFWEVRQQTQRDRSGMQLDALSRLTEEWNSADMEDLRSSAAGALLDGAPTPDIDEVLNFFDWLALLLNRGMLDEEMVWHEFYWPMANYWFASQDRVEEVHRGDPMAWQDLGSAMSRLVGVEARRKQKTSGTAVPSESQMREFLMDEAGDEGECAEGNGDRQTPL